MTVPEPIIAGRGKVRHVGVYVDVGEFTPERRWVPICGEQSTRWKLPATPKQRIRPICKHCLWKADRIQQFAQQNRPKPDLVVSPAYVETYGLPDGYRVDHD